MIATTNAMKERIHDSSAFRVLKEGPTMYIASGTKAKVKYWKARNIIYKTSVLLGLRLKDKAMAVVAIGRVAQDQNGS